MLVNLGLAENSMGKKRNAFILLIGVSVVAILLVKASLVPTSVWRGTYVDTERYVSQY